MTDRRPRRRQGGPWLGNDRARAQLEGPARRRLETLRRTIVLIDGERFVEYQLTLEVPDYGPHNVRILFRLDRATVGEPVVFTDRPQCSPHRHEAKNSLCMWHYNDPPSARWVPGEGLNGLVDYIWRHLYREHHWHEHGHEWLGPEHPHGTAKESMKGDF